MTAPERSGGKMSAEIAAANTPEAQVGAARRLCESVFRGLSRWMGIDGSRALFTRALAQARAEHPSLESIQLNARPDSSLAGVEEAMRSHGAPATVAALESAITELVSLLGRLIGDDMALKLVSHASQERGKNVDHSSSGGNSQ